MLRLLKNFALDLHIFILTIVGYIPIHEFRKLIYRLSGVFIGENTSFHWRARFYCPYKLSVGDNTIIGNDCMLDARNGITIGNNVSLSMGVWIWTLEHDPQDPLYGTKGGLVTIGDYAWVSCRVVILPGVTIGKGAVIAAGAVVTQDVADYTIVGGVPAKLIGRRSEDLRYNLNFHKSFQ
jgi:maltose O-acetyltransferase